MEAKKNTSSNRKVKYLVRKRPVVEDALVHDETFIRMKKILPQNYNFEIEKTIAKIKSENCNMIALQFPEGLLMYACILVDIFVKFTGVQVLILGDVTYGACCVDDYTAHKLGADLLVHYGHSCLVPLQCTKIKVMYVFVEIQFDISHLVATVKANFNTKSNESNAINNNNNNNDNIDNDVVKSSKNSDKLALLGTIQFVSSVFALANALREVDIDVMIPQCKPLSPAETLGCTAPILPKDITKAIFVADGRFHLEAAMIQNPSIPFYRYDPYSKVLSAEGYDIALMKSIRMKSIVQARSAKRIGLILGTLGRQGNVNIHTYLRQNLHSHVHTYIETCGMKIVPFLMAEVNLSKLELIKDIDAWVQVSCPRLSIDWGAGFCKPLLTPYEFLVCVGAVPWMDEYPMDYYSAGSGPWTNYHHGHT